MFELRASREMRDPVGLAWTHPAVFGLILKTQNPTVFNEIPPKWCQKCDNFIIFLCVIGAKYPQTCNIRVLRGRHDLMIFSWISELFDGLDGLQQCCLHINPPLMRHNAVDGVENPSPTDHETCSVDCISVIPSWKHLSVKWGFRTRKTDQIM